MSSALIVPERNERERPLAVVEAGLASPSVDRVYVVDGWSTDGTDQLLAERLPELGERHGKPVELVRSRLRNTGKGGAMVTGIQQALADGSDRIAFLDADITSMTSAWCDLLIEGVDRYKVAVTRGAFDRSPHDAQITRHITRPLMNRFFPEGREITQPLGGELCMSGELARWYLEGNVAPPHTWGIDTFFTVNGLVGGFRSAEIYLVQKTHNRKGLEDLRHMFVECFDEMAVEIHLHARDRSLPVRTESLVTVVPKEASQLPRVGDDVRIRGYVDLQAEVARFAQGLAAEPVSEEELERLGLPEEGRAFLLRLFGDPDGFAEGSRALDAGRWVSLLERLVQGYIASEFDPGFHKALFHIWRARALAFILHEASDFETAEQNTQRLADLAFRRGQERLTV
ncbi:MAG: glycosyltransferase [Anaerolineae bacterium]